MWAPNARTKVCSSEAAVISKLPGLCSVSNVFSIYRSGTVEPRYNKLLHNKEPGLTNFVLHLSNTYSTMRGKEPRYHEPALLSNDIMKTERAQFSFYRGLANVIFYPKDKQC